MLCAPKAKKIVYIKDKLYNHCWVNPNNTSNDPKQKREFNDRRIIGIKNLREVWNKEGYFKFDVAKIEFLKWAYAGNYWRSNKKIDKKVVEAIGKDLLKDEVLNLLDKNTRNGIKKMIENAKS